MLRDGASTFLVTQLLYNAPLLAVYAVAAVLALVFMGRSRGASILTLLASAILIVTTLGGAAVQSYLLWAQQEGDWSTSQTGWMMGTVGFAGVLGRVIGYSLLVAAVFVGRARPAQETGGLPGTRPREHLT